MTYKEDLREKKQRLIRKKRNHELLNKWLIENSTLNPEWDSKIEEFKRLTNEIEVLEFRISEGIKSYNRKHQYENFNF